MKAQAKRGLEILSQTKYDQYNKIPAELGDELHEFIHSITPEQVQDEPNINFVPLQPLLFGAQEDVNRMYSVPRKGRALANTFTHTMRGFRRVFPYLTDEGLEIAADIFNTIDKIADTLAGEDDE